MFRPSHRVMGQCRFLIICPLLSFVSACKPVTPAVPTVVGAPSAASTSTPAPPPTLAPFVVGALPPGSQAALTKAGIRLDRVTHILPAPIFPDEKRMSGGTHGLSGRNAAGQVYGCAIDLAPAFDPAERRREIRRLRLAGFAAWSRGVTEPGGPAGNGDHYHLIWAGTKTTNPDQRQQLCSFLSGYRGVANGRSRRHWLRDATIRPDEIRAVRHLWTCTSGRRVVERCRPYESLHRPYQ